MRVYKVCPDNTKVNWAMMSLFIAAVLIGIPKISFPANENLADQIQRIKYDNGGFDTITERVLTVEVDITV
jgi:hypothetical protein